MNYAVGCLGEMGINYGQVWGIDRDKILVEMDCMYLVAYDLDQVICAADVSRETP